MQRRTTVRRKVGLVAGICLGLGIATAAWAGPEEPPARQRATVFTIGGEAYVLGGTDPDAPLTRDDFFNDFWEFSGENWVEVPDSPGDDGPPAVESAPSALTEDGNDALIFPGFRDDGSVFDEIFFYLRSVNQFIGLETPHPDSLGGASVAAGQDQVFLAGGRSDLTGPPTSTGRVFDLATSTFGELIQLSESVDAGAGFFSSLLGTFGFLFGGDALGTAPSTAVQVVEDAGAATLLGGGPTIHLAVLLGGPGIPEARTDQASAQRGNQVAVFGGRDADGELLGDLWLIDADVLAAEVVGGAGAPSSAPFTFIGEFPPRAQASLAFLDNGRLLLFGGEDEAGNTLQGTQIILLEPAIFTDDFETGDTTRWSATVE